jgi:hypothetical protein
VHWTRGHSETVAAGLASLFLAAFLFRPPSAATGVLMVLLVLIAVVVADRIRTEDERSGS